MTIYERSREILRRLRAPAQRTAVLATCFAASFALFAVADSPKRLFCFALTAGVFAALLLYPEFALALYVVVGDVKGDDRVASLFPVDLTLALAALLMAGILLNSLRGKRIVRMPPMYFLFLALTALMAMSLSYTPMFDAGADKFGRFLVVTGVVIAAPFFVLDTPRTMKRFFIAFGVAAYAICSYSLSRLGGSDRLVTPSDNTIGLGHVACALFAVIWFAAIPKLSLAKRMLTYPLLLVPAAALIGSGSRGPALALALVIVASLFFYRHLLFDAVCLLAAGLIALPLLNIPQSSLEYLGSLLAGKTSGALLDFRGELLDYGWRLLQQHPLIGTGIGGFRYSSPNPGTYKWPHNIFLELACELGIPAALLVIAIFSSAIRESWRQLRDRSSPQVSLSLIAAGLLVIGIVNALNTGDINSDRSTWLFMSLVFVIRGYRMREAEDLDRDWETIAGDRRLAEQTE
jgi:putative inorganic carbon (hco3(-)) transporter